MWSGGAGVGPIAFLGVFSLASPLSWPREGRACMVPAECQERLVFVGFFFFLLLMGDLCSVLPPLPVQLRQGKKVSAKCCDFRKAEIKVLCRLSKPLQPGNKRAWVFL